MTKRGMKVKGRFGRRKPYSIWKSVYNYNRRKGLSRSASYKGASNIGRKRK